MFSLPGLVGGSWIVLCFLKGIALFFECFPFSRMHLAAEWNCGDFFVDCDGFCDGFS